MKTNSFKKIFLLFIPTTLFILCGCNKYEELYPLPTSYDDMEAEKHLAKITELDREGNVSHITNFTWDGDKLVAIEQIGYNNNDGSMMSYSWTIEYNNGLISRLNYDDASYVDLEHNGRFLTRITPSIQEGVYCNDFYYTEASDVLDIRVKRREDEIYGYSIFENVPDGPKLTPVWENRNFRYFKDENGDVYSDFIMEDFEYDNKINVYRCLPRDIVLINGLGGVYSDDFQPSVEAMRNMSKNNWVYNYENENGYDRHYYEYDGDYPIASIFELLQYTDGGDNLHIRRVTYYEYTDGTGRR